MIVDLLSAGKTAEEILSHITANFYTQQVRPAYPYDAYCLNTGIMIDLIRRELLPEI